MAAALAACDLPFSLGLPTTRSLEIGASDTLVKASDLEITGSYSDGTHRWSIDLQMARPKSEHVVVTSSNVKLEAIIIGNDAYYRGQEYLSAHMGDDLVSRSFVKAAGNSWWKGAAREVPQLTDLTDGNVLKSTFLGQAVTQRTDHVSIDGHDAVELSGPRAEVFIASQHPFRVLRLRLKHGVVIDGIHDADLRYGYNRNVQIAAPPNVIDFSNLSTLPPIYTVLSVDTSACGATCTVSALIKNLGGVVGARARSVITFTMTDSGSRQTVGSCQAPVVPDVPYNATTTVSCTIDKTADQHSNAATVTATPENPGSG